MNLGAVKFTKWADAQQEKKQKLADSLMITRMEAYRLLNGRSIPTLATAIRIEDMTNGAVSIRDWIAAEKK